MSKLAVILAFGVFLVGGQAQAAVLNNVTIKSIGFLNAGGNAILNIEINESVIFENCPVATTYKILTASSATAPDAWLNTWASVLMTAQAQDMKVNFLYEACNGMFGAVFTGVNIHR